MPDFDGIKDKLEDFAEAAKPVMEKAGEVIKDKGGDFVEAAKPVVAKAGEVIKEKAGEAGEAIKNKAEEITNKDLDRDGKIGKGE